MRIAEGPAAQQATLLQRAGDRVDHRNLQRLRRGQGRQEARQSGGQHGLSGARRADHQKVVAAGRCDLQGAFGGLLPLDVHQVRPARAERLGGRLRRTQHLRALEVIDEAQQRLGRQEVDPLCPGRLATLAGRADQALVQSRGVDGCRQHTGRLGDAAVQRQLAQSHVVGDLAGRQHLHGRQKAECDRQVEVAALLQQVGGREIDDETLGRQAEADGMQRRLHPFAALRHGLVRQPDDGKGGKSGADLHLDVDFHHLDAQKGDGTDPRNHSDRRPMLVFDRSSAIRNRRSEHSGHAGKASAGVSALGGKCLGAAPEPPPAPG